MAGHALVTGCSSGIGLAIARKLLADGWMVTGISRTPPDLAAPHFRHIAADLGDADASAAAFRGIGPVNAVVHAAGLLRVGDHETMDVDEGAAMWRLHVDAAARLVQAVAPGMASGGRIVFIGSRVSVGAPGRGLYAASKAALVGLARSFAAELAPRGITVNVIAPGATDTPMLRDPARAAVRPILPPIGRLVTPEEVAALTAFLLSDMAGSITGQQIMICGGASL